MYRLTVHVTDVPRTEVRTGRKIKNASGKWVEEVKQKIYNVISYACKDQSEIAKRLGQIRSKYTIMKGIAGQHKVSKVDKEFIQISNIK
jgi:hypothetical protein